MKKTEHKAEDILLNRVNALMTARVILVTLLLGLPLLLRLETLKNPWSITTFYFLMGATYCLSIFYALFLKVKGPSLYFISCQLSVDLLLETILISVSGGLGSPFPFLYIITIVSASIFFHQWGGVFMAGSSTLLFALVALLEYSRIPPFETGIVLDNRQVFYMLFLYMIAFFTVGTLSGRLALRLREKEIGFLDLRVFHEDIVHSMPSGLITTDLDGRITSFNRSAIEITGYHYEEVVGKRWWDHFSWLDVQKRFNALAASGFPQRFEGEILDKNGEPCLLGVTISSLRNDKGTQTGIIGTFQDLTEIRNLEEAIHRKERLATIGEMAAGMAHEIRNPLASLSGSIQVLQKELQLGGENGKLMEIAIKESERLSNFVTQFLQYARPLPPQREWVNLHELLSETALLIQHDPAYTHQVKMLLEESAGEDRAFVDPDQMKQIFWNLGNNAYQAMSSGGTLSLAVHRVTNQKGVEYIEILFTDTGKGISEEDLPNIFEPFFTTKSAGSGLGLAIVLRVVEEHFGEISVKSQEGKTSFHIRLPLTSAEAPYHKRNPMLEDDLCQNGSDDETDRPLDPLKRKKRFQLASVKK